MTRTITRLLIGCMIIASARQTTAAPPSFAPLGEDVGGLFPRGVSADGSVVVGNGGFGLGPEAFRWTASEGVVGLGDFVGGDFSSGATGVSDDGSVIVGFGASASGIEAFRWTAAGGMVGLGDLTGGDFSSIAGAVSADGSVVVGSGTNDIGSDAFRWTADDGLVGLGTIPGTSPFLLNGAFDVSADGSVLVGGSVPISGSHPFEGFRWTSDDGLVGLGNLPGGAIGSAQGVSADGSVIVGFSTSANISAIFEAFIWDETNGLRNLREVLTNDFDLDLTGWTLRQAMAISADGRTIVGSGKDPNGTDQAWIAVIPEPSTFTLAGFGLAALATFGWRRRQGDT